MKKINYIKMQSDALKLLDKDPKGRFPVCQVLEDSVWLTNDGYRVFIIPKERFFLDASKMNSNELTKCIGTGELDTAFFRGELRTSPDGAHTVRKIESESCFAWVDEKLLKEYGDIEYYGIKGEFAPVNLYDKMFNLLGFVLPVNVRSWEK